MIVELNRYVKDKENEEFSADNIIEENGELKFYYNGLLIRTLCANDDVDSEIWIQW